MQNQQDSFEASLDVLNKSLKRTRKKSSYKKINNETRQKLIEMVIKKIYIFRFI